MATKKERMAQVDWPRVDRNIQEGGITLLEMTWITGLSREELREGLAAWKARQR